MFQTYIHDILSEIDEIGGFLWNKGWAERNAGNISVNVTGLVPSKIYPTHNFIEISLEYPFHYLSCNTLVVTISGSQMRRFSQKNSENICLLSINSEGNKATIYIPGKNSNATPTSELSTHLAIQNQLVAQNAKEKAVLHSHVTEMIALTHIPGLNQEKALNTLLFSMHPEISLFIPDGVGFVPFSEPGSHVLAEKTLQALEKHKVAVWEKHGCISVGQTVGEAFDYLDITAKAAYIYLLSRSKFQ
ncbi:MAG: rhamnulose-1-phosphate aldolase [Lentimicrobiaceae bacterium]|jgi:rhamnulose-1-phosphate aldolase|nr:rhamnulose-1-phosphate aldolase [Lentimicrobiaceae bacterium]